MVQNQGTWARKNGDFLEILETRSEIMTLGNPENDALKFINMSVNARAGEEIDLDAFKRTLTHKTLAEMTVGVSMAKAQKAKFVSKFDAMGVKCVEASDWESMLDMFVECSEGVMQQRKIDIDKREAALDNRQADFNANAARMNDAIRREQAELDQRHAVMDTKQDDFVAETARVESQIQQRQIQVNQAQATLKAQEAEFATKVAQADSARRQMQIELDKRQSAIETREAEVEARLVQVNSEAQQKHTKFDERQTAIVAREAELAAEITRLKQASLAVAQRDAHARHLTLAKAAQESLQRFAVSSLYADLAQEESSYFATVESFAHIAQREETAKQLVEAACRKRQQDFDAQQVETSEKLKSQHQTEIESLAEQSLRQANKQRIIYRGHKDRIRKLKGNVALLNGAINSHVDGVIGSIILEQRLERLENDRNA